MSWIRKSLGFGGLAVLMALATGTRAQDDSFKQPVAAVLFVSGPAPGVVVQVPGEVSQIAVAKIQFKERGANAAKTYTWAQKKGTVQGVRTAQADYVFNGKAVVKQLPRALGADAEFRFLGPIPAKLTLVTEKSAEGTIISFTPTDIGFQADSIDKQAFTYPAAQVLEVLLDGKRYIYDRKRDVLVLAPMVKPKEKDPEPMPPPKVEPKANPPVESKDKTDAPKEPSTPSPKDKSPEKKDAEPAATQGSAAPPLPSAEKVLGNCFTWMIGILLGAAGLRAVFGFRCPACRGWGGARTRSELLATGHEAGTIHTTNGVETGRSGFERYSLYMDHYDCPHCQHHWGSQPYKQYVEFTTLLFWVFTLPRWFFRFLTGLCGLVVRLVIHLYYSLFPSRRKGQSHPGGTP